LPIALKWLLETRPRRVHHAEMTGSAAIECRNLYKIFGLRPEAALAALQQGLGKPEIKSKYDSVVGVHDVSFSVEPGEVFCIMGLSGSGKSTLVRHINRLVEPTAGSIFIQGEDIGRKSHRAMRKLRAEKIGMVFQNFALLPHLNVIDNVALGLELRKLPRDERVATARRKLELVQLSEWGEAWPEELSGGMQQRVGLARALASDPDILLMDEPFSALDPLIRRQLQDLFIDLSRQMRKTTVFITHDLAEAIRIGHRIGIMRDGRMVQIGTPSDIVNRPRDDYVKAFVQGISRLTVLSAADIMEPAGNSDATLAAEQHWPESRPAALLDELIDLTADSDLPILIRDCRGAPAGIVRRRILLRSIQGK
jgi:glycine betaine/proline transport system ATP-binding protein